MSFLQWRCLQNDVLKLSQESERKKGSWETFSRREAFQTTWGGVLGKRNVKNEVFGLSSGGKLSKLRLGAFYMRERGKIKF